MYSVLEGYLKNDKFLNKTMRDLYISKYATPPKMEIPTGNTFFQNI